MTATTSSGRCQFCGSPVDRDRDYEGITGWAKGSRHGAGGTNAVALKTPTGEWACSACIAKMRRGLAAEQADLFAG
jgi:hypothetical protein